MSTDWKVYTYEQVSGGGWEWVLDDDSLRRPNLNLVQGILSNHTTVTLANGKKTSITPGQTGSYSPVTLVWVQDDGTLLSQFKGYIQEGVKIKITTHNASHTFIGRVSSATPEWFTGIELDGGDYFDIAIVLDITETIEPE